MNFIIPIACLICGYDSESLGVQAFLRLVEARVLGVAVLTGL